MTESRKFDNISIKAADLGCSRGQYPVFEGIGFSLGCGQGLFVRGANGSGKTSLLMVMAGVLPHSGSLEISRGGKEEDGNGAPDSQLLHFIGIQNAIRPELTLGQNLQFWAGICGGDEQRIPGALAEAGLSGLGNFSAGFLSTGQKRRLSLCRLLVSHRPIWLLDEPTSALDEQGDRWVGRMISKHLGMGGIVVAATHRPIEVENRDMVRSMGLGK